MTDEEFLRDMNTWFMVAPVQLNLDVSNVPVRGESVQRLLRIISELKKQLASDACNTSGDAK